MSNPTRTCSNAECGASIDDRPRQARFCSRRCCARYHHVLARLDPVKRVRENERHARYSKARAEQRAAISRARYERKNPDARPYSKRGEPRTPEQKRQAAAENARRRYARQIEATSVPFTVADIQARLAFWGNRCWMCGDAATCVDHVKPLFRGGPHLLANLRPACKPCNSKKQSQWFGTAEIHRFMRI